MILNGIQFDTENVLDWRVTEASAAEIMEIEVETLANIRLTGYGPKTEIGDDGEAYYRFRELAVWDLLTSAFQSEFMRQVSLVEKHGTAGADKIKSALGY